MVDLKQIRDYIIVPSLKAVDLYSDEARDLLLYTGLVESGYKYVAQLGGGPARSFWQVEPSTMWDVYANYLSYREPLKAQLEDIQSIPSIDALTSNMCFSVIMARLVYRRSPDPLPPIGDGPGMAAYWKRIYNTEKGSGKEEDFIRLWEKEKL